MAEHPTVRLFFAIQPDALVLHQLVRVQHSLRPAVKCRWLPPANLHVTLVFLGQVAAARAPELKALAANIRSAAFSLELNRLECWRGSRVLCLTPSVIPAGLNALVADLSAELERAGFRLEKRPYRAHLTLARDSMTDEPCLPLSAPIRLEPRSFSLYESSAMVRGSVYRRLGTWPLAKPGPADAAAGHGRSECIPFGGMR